MPTLPKRPLLLIVRDGWGHNPYPEWNKANAVYLAKKPVDDGTARGYLAVTSKSPAKIVVDGVDTGLSTPITGHMLPLSPGKHKVTFVIGNDRVTFPVVIKAGENSALHKDL